MNISAVVFFRKTFFGEDACDVLNKIIPGHVAMLDEYAELQFELKTICKMPDDSILEKFRIARKPVRSTGHGWAMQLGAPFQPAIDYFMSLFLSGRFWVGGLIKKDGHFYVSFSAGLFKKWTQNVTGKLAASLIPKSREIKSNDVAPLSLQRFSPLLTIYCIGICISILCFSTEILIRFVRKLRIVFCNRRKRNKFNLR